MVRSRGTTPAALIACAAVVACPVPAPSQAAGLSTPDGEGDVWEAVYDDSGVLEDWVEAGSVVNGDVVSTRARHKAKRIVFITRYASLARAPGENRFMTQQRMRFAGGSTASVQVHTFRRWRGESYLADDDTGSGMRCPGLVHEIDYAADRVRVSFPRACVDRPRWLRYVGLAYALSGSDTETGEDDHNYLDNALNDGHRRGTANRNTSPRIFAG